MKLCRSNQRMILNKKLINGCSDLLASILCFATCLHKLSFRNSFSAKPILLGRSVYVCAEHKPEVLDGFFEALNSVSNLIHECENGHDVTSLPNGLICYVWCKRLN